MEDLVQAIIRYYNNSGIEVNYKDSEFHVAAEMQGNRVSFVCQISQNFPYEFPLILLDQPTKSALRGMPHQFIDGNQLCVFDYDVSIPNVRQPENIIIDTIDKAIDLLTNRTPNVDEQAFVDEFKAYWEGPISNDVVFDAFIDAPNIYRLLYCYQLKNRMVAAESKEKLLSIVKNIQLSTPVLDGMIFRAINIPLKTISQEMLTTAQGKWLDIMRDHSDYYCEYCNYLRNKKFNKHFVIFSFQQNGRWLSCGFIHSPIGDDGRFRKGKTPTRLMLLGTKGDTDITRFSIRDCSQKRMYERGGIGDICNFDRVSVIGCGSLGSNLASALATCGAREFKLYDNQQLSMDNIARHYCGYWYVDMPKVNALMLQLTMHNPNIICDCISDNIHNVLRLNAAKLDLSDICFVTTADIAVDYHMVECFNNMEIQKPIVIVWLEPYAIAAHAIVLQKRQDIFYELYDQQLNYKFSVIKDPEKYRKRDTGCQSTFIPYSGLHVRTFVNLLVNYCLTSDIFVTKANYRLHWLGSLDIVEKFDIIIKDEYKDTQWDTLYCERISSD